MRSPHTATGSSPHSLQLEKSPCSNDAPAQLKNTINLKKKKKKDIKHKEQWEGIHIRKEKEETEVAGVRV